MKRHWRRNRATTRAGFTLVETLVAVALSSVLLVGLGSTVYVALRASDGTGAVPTTLRTASATWDLADELRLAASFSERSSRLVEFSIADRNGDESPETIRYEWSGIAGDPLVRQLNEGKLVDVLEDVRQFQLTYDVRSSTQAVPGQNESAETQFVEQHSSQDLSDRTITSSNWIGQYFKPAMPADAVSWKVTRVQFEARTHDTADGLSMVQLRTADGSNLPTGTIIDERSLYENGLSVQYSWTEVNFDAASGLSPSAGLCLVIKYASGNRSCRIRYRDEEALTPTSDMLTTTNGGATWTSASNQSMQLYVYGTITTSGPPPASSLYFVTRVGVEVQAGGDQATAMQTSVYVLNTPEVSGL